MFCSGLEGGESIFDMMKFADVLIGGQSKFALIRGLIVKGDLEAFKKALVDYSFAMDEDMFLVALEDLSANDRLLWLPEVRSFFVQQKLIVSTKFAAVKNHKYRRVFKPFPYRRTDVVHSID